MKTKVSNLQEYGTIILGSPNWWGSIVSPIRTFLAENDMSGKN
ncbi:MAG: flavodoxin family protein [Bacilli bacterium]